MHRAITPGASVGDSQTIGQIAKTTEDIMHGRTASKDSGTSGSEGLRSSLKNNFHPGMHSFGAPAGDNRATGQAARVEANVMPT